MTKLSNVTAFKVTENDGDIQIEMTGEGLLISLNGQQIPDVRVWHALSGIIVETANAPALVHRLTSAFNGGQAGMRANADGSGLVFTFNEGSLPDSVKQTLVTLGQDEQATVALINASVAQGESNAAEFAKRFPRGTGYRPRH